MCFGQPSFFIALWSTLILSGCFGDPAYLQQDKNTGSRLSTVGIATTSIDGGVISAAIKADDTRSQIIKADDVQNLKGTSVVVPPGALSIDVTITIEEAVPLATTTLAQQLGISGQFAVSGTAISIQADKDVSLKKPFGIALPVPGMTTLALNDPYANLFVIYKVKNVESSEIVLGTIPRSALEIINGEVRFSTTYFGAFQVAFAEQPVESKKVVTEEPILTKREEATATVASLTLDLGNLATDGWINAEESQGTSALFIVSKASHKEITYSQVLSDNPLLVCNEKVDYKLKDVPLVKNIPSADGTYAICARVVDELKKPHFFKSPLVKKDVTSPTVDVGVDRTEAGAFAINASSQGAVKWAWSKVSGPGNITFSAPQAEDTSVTANMSGNYVLRLTVEDEAGNKASDELTATISMMPIIISFSLIGEAADGYINNQEKTSTNPLISVQATNFDAIYFHVKPEDIMPCNETLPYSPISPTTQDLTTDAGYIVCVKLVGSDGSTVYAPSPLIMRDTVAPSVDAGTDVTSNTSFNRSIVLIGDYTFQWTQTSGPGTITFSNPTSSNPTISASAAGMYVIRLTVKDMAGNEGYDEFNLQWGDTLAGFLTPANDASDGFINANEANSTSSLFTLTQTAAVSIAYTTILVGTPSCDASLTYSEDSIPSINSITSDGLYTLCTKLTDASLNEIYVSGTVERDTTPPTVNVGPDLIRNQTFFLDATTSGATAFQWQKMSGPGTVSFTSPSTEDTQVTIVGDGSYNIRLTVSDNAGNQAYDDLIIEWDQTPPTPPAISLTLDASDGFINAMESSSTQPMFDITGVGGTIQYSDAVDPLTTCNESISYPHTLIPRPVDLGSADDSYIFCLKLEDIAGNVSYAPTPTVIKDTEAPSGIINVLGIPSVVFDKNSFTITVSGIDVARFEYRVSATPLDSCEVLSPSYIMSPSLSANVNLSSLPDGPVRLCVVGLDHAGNRQPYANAFKKDWHKAVTSVNAIQIAAGEAHVCALFSNHKVRCWGRNLDGQLGYETSANVGDVPNEMNNLPEVNLGTNILVQQIAAGGNHTCALTLEGKVKCWGLNGAGQLGIGGSASKGHEAGTMGDNLSHLSFSVKVKKLALGSNHSCALFVDHTVKCWGNNSKGELGIDSYTSVDAASTATAVNLGGKKALDISAGVNRSCAILDDHSAKCWGSNVTEATGVSTPYPNVGGTELPVSSAQSIIFGSQKPLSIETGSAHTCALMDDHHTKCWGTGVYGQLGNNSTSTVLSTAIANVQTAGLSYHRQIAMGYQHSCALMNDFTVTCWGDNSAGAIGDGTTTNKLTPMTTSLSPKAVQIVTGNSFSCAILTDSQIACWGRNDSGQIGQGTTASVLTPQVINFGIPPTLSVLSLSTNVNHTCAILSDRSVRCWGDNQHGQLGIGASGNNVGAQANQMGANLPLISFGGAKTMQIVTGMEHTCALIDSGDVQCWGNGSSGQNGVQDTTFTSPSSSINFGSGPKPVKIVAGYSHTCALFPDSGIKCWGYNVNGQLGQGNQANFINSSSELTSHPPVDLGTERKAVDVFARGHHTCAILDNHDLKCWGYNNQGQLGQADQDSRGHTPGTLGDDLPPVSLGTNRKVIDVVMGPFNTCALLDDGLAKCFGANDKGQSGQAGADVIGPADGQSGDGLLSLSLGTNTIAQALATGLAHTCALLDGIVKCFGDGGQGALGNEVSGAYGPTTGNMGDYLSPVNFGTDLKAVQVVAGENHTCVLTQLGWVKCWGNSGLGQLGLETNAPQGNTSGTMGDHLDFIRLW